MEDDREILQLAECHRQISVVSALSAMSKKTTDSHSIAGFEDDVSAIHFALKHSSFASYIHVLCYRV